MSPGLIGRCGGGSGGGIIAWGAIAVSTGVQTIPAYPDPASSLQYDFTGGAFTEDGQGIFSYDSGVDPVRLYCTVPQRDAAFFLIVRMTLGSITNPAVYPFDRLQVQMLSSWLPSGISPSQYRAGLAPHIQLPTLPAPGFQMSFPSTELILLTGNQLDPVTVGIQVTNWDSAGGNSVAVRGGAVWAALAEA